MKKTVFWVATWSLFCVLVWFAWSKGIDPNIATQASLNQVNGGAVEWSTMNMVLCARSHAGQLLVLVWLIVAAAITFRLNNGLFAVTLIAASMTGCVRDYDVPEFVEVQPSQTAYVIPLDTATSGQVKFESAALLEARKVAAKRIQVPHRWIDTGYLHNSGEYKATVRVILVDRSPVTRNWNSDDAQGKKGKDQAIWVESADSVGFSMGWNCTAFIREEDASTFLYWYPSGSLAAVMDTEVRARIQQVSATECAKVKLDELRSKKNEIATAVRSDVTEFYQKRGITITAVGMYGGMTYENKDIQIAIDKTFITQQEKVNAAAMLDAQADKNKRITQEADALADAARKKAKGEADGIEFINQALTKAANNPQLIQLRALEVERARIDKWGGTYPSVVAGSGANAWIGMGTMPETTAKQ